MAKKVKALQRQNGEIGCYVFWCPGCNEAHMFTKDRWAFNDNFEKPTFSPSLLYPTKAIRCHLFMRDGKIQYLSDCGHKLAGQTIDCPDWDEEYL